MLRGALRFALVPALPLFVAWCTNLVVSAAKATHLAAPNRLEVLLRTCVLVPLTSLPGFLVAVRMCGPLATRSPRFATVSAVAGWISLLIGLSIVLGVGDALGQPNLSLAVTPIVALAVSWALIRLVLCPAHGWPVFSGTGLCCHCGYSLQGIVGKECPECGASRYTD